MLRETIVQVPGDVLSPTAIHRAVWSAMSIPGKKTRDFIFRAVGDGQIYVRGKSLPEDRSLPVRTLSAGKAVNFVLLVRAVHRNDNGEYLVDRDDLLGWLTERMQGFDAIELTETVPVKSNIKGHPVWAWSLKGSATIESPEAAESVLEKGIGRSKAFGFGMLVVA